MFDRPDNGERAVLVYINFISRLDEEELHEFRELALSAGAEPIAVVTGARKKPDPKYLIGEAKAQEIREQILSVGADIVLVDHRLTPAQERNLERFLQCRVLDRTGLILDIFAQRATTHEGRLQVELAQLQHLSTRLVRGWTHLERQKGGIGLRGPGETQLETDRRLIGLRIKQLAKRLSKVHNRRQQGRRARKKADIATVSLVGYTNAGKSTLFNRITQADVFAQDQLFATLDPTLRRCDLGGNSKVILVDTVGFIRQLPHDLVQAFHSTLEETREASLLLHIIDASYADSQGNIQHVNAVLKEIGAEHVPQLEVYNKIDLVAGFEQGACQPRIDRDETGQAVRVWVSAYTGEGIALLLQAMKERMAGDMLHQWVCVAPGNGRLRSLIYKNANVLRECIDDTGDILLEIVISYKDLSSIQAKEGVKLEKEPDKRVINCCG
ncbi:MAG: GTPase HflX [Gammaproteobacteria bacterium]|nr:GTPase HflX [Gammaproteobacteria bacterium]